MGEKALAAMTVAISPSQVVMWQSCPRKWAMKYLAKVPDTESYGREFGKRGHQVLQDWKEKGTPPDRGTPEGELILQCLPTVEKAFANIDKHEQTFGRRLGNALVQARLDGVRRRHRQYAAVTDFKFSSDECWCPSPEELSNNPQVLINAWVLDADEVDCFWVYFFRKQQTAKIIAIPRFGRAELDARMQPLGKSIRKIHSAWQRFSQGLHRDKIALSVGAVNEMFPVKDACFDYFDWCPAIRWCTQI